jgi:phage terminase small subunit
MLSNIRRERFAQLLAEGKTATDAYGEAGFKPNTGNASTMANDPEIVGRVNELKMEHRERHDVTIDALTDELDEAIQMAFENKQPGHAIQGIQAKAKLHGLMIDRSRNETVSTNYVISAEPDEDDAEAWLEKYKPK